MSKWSRTHVVEVLENGQWIAKTKPTTEAQAARLLLNNPYLRRFFENRQYRITNTRTLGE